MCVCVCVCVSLGWVAHMCVNLLLVCVCVCVCVCVGGHLGLSPTSKCVYSLLLLLLLLVVVVVRSSVRHVSLEWVAHMCVNLLLVCVCVWEAILEGVAMGMKPRLCPWNETQICACVALKKAILEGVAVMVEVAKAVSLEWVAHVCPSSLWRPSGRSCSYGWGSPGLCPWDSETCASAAHGGHLEGVAMGEKPRLCPWDEKTCACAARGGHLEVMQWLRSQGCPWAHSYTCVVEKSRLSVGWWDMCQCCSSWMAIWKCCNGPENKAVPGKVK